MIEYTVGIYLNFTLSNLFKNAMGNDKHAVNVELCYRQETT